MKGAITTSTVAVGMIVSMFLGFGGYVISRMDSHEKEDGTIFLELTKSTTQSATAISAIQADVKDIKETQKAILKYVK